MDYDALMDGRREQLEREDAAETRRVQREAGRAFDRLAARAPRHATIAPSRVTSPALSPERAAQVAAARAAVAALGTDGYAAVYSIGGAR